ncbi:MAG: Glutamyl-tRNA reductase [Candidatus Heimdallarchaeota archaeon LC_3]|nr:MAG: Glutamyl-tRNA reductase [Candidatus Heimdallarchaeota archaeon LC_3]
MAVTWKLRDLSQEEFENISKNTLNPEEFQTNNGVLKSLFILKTCERILFVYFNYSTYITNEKQPNQECQTYKIINYITKENIVPINTLPVIYRGKNAFNHLCLVSSSVDSSVLGETQILGQFKEAFKKQKEIGMIKNSLEEILQYVIRTAKRVFHLAELPKGKVSVISNVNSYINKWISKFNNNEKPTISIIGTGEMGRSVLGYFKDLSNFNIGVYSRNRNLSSEGQSLIGFPIGIFSENIDEIFKSQIIVFCSQTKEPFISKEFLSNLRISIERKILILDLGIPSNCYNSINDLDHIHLFQMNNMVNYSNQNYQDREKRLPLVQKIISKETQKIEIRMNKKILFPLIKELREKIQTSSNQRIEELKMDFTETLEFKKWFKRTIGEVMFISQEFLEKMFISKQDSKSEIKNDSELEIGDQSFKWEGKSPHQLNMINLGGFEE